MDTLLTFLGNPPVTWVVSGAAYATALWIGIVSWIHGDRVNAREAREFGKGLCAAFAMSALLAAASSLAAMQLKPPQAPVQVQIDHYSTGAPPIGPVRAWYEFAKTCPDAYGQRYYECWAEFEANWPKQQTETNNGDTIHHSD